MASGLKNLRAGNNGTVLTPRQTARRHIWLCWCAYAASGTGFAVLLCGSLFAGHWLRGYTFLGSAVGSLFLSSALFVVAESARPSNAAARHRGHRHRRGRHHLKHTHPEWVRLPWIVTGGGGGRSEPDGRSC